MNIAIIRGSTSILKPDFYNSQEFGLSKELINFGCNVDIYYATDMNKEKIEILYTHNEYKCRVIYLPVIRIIAQQGILKNLFKYLKKTHYDIIQTHEYDNINSILAILWSKFHKIKVVIYQGVYENYRAMIPKFLGLTYDFLFLPIIRNNCNAIICKTENAKRFLERKKLFVTDVCRVGLNVEKYKVNSRLSNKNRKEKRRNFVLLYVGIIEERRNPFLLIDITKRLVSNNYNVELWIVGGGPLFRETIDYTKKEKIIDNVKFFDRMNQDELSDIYNKSNLLLLPSRYEIYGMVILEAMFHCLPVVASNTAGPREIINNSVNGIIVEDYKINSWVDAIKKIIDNPNYYNLLRLNSRKNIEENFLWEITVKSFIKVYKSLIS